MPRKAQVEEKDSIEVVQKTPRKNRKGILVSSSELFAENTSIGISAVSIALNLKGCAIESNIHEVRLGELNLDENNIRVNSYAHLYHHKNSILRHGYFKEKPVEYFWDYEYDTPTDKLAGKYAVDSKGNPKFVKVLLDGHSRTLACLELSSEKGIKTFAVNPGCIWAIEVSKPKDEAEAAYLRAAKNKAKEPHILDHVQCLQKLIGAGISLYYKDGTATKTVDEKIRAYCQQQDLDFRYVKFIFRILNALPKSVKEIIYNTEVYHEASKSGVISSLDEDESDSDKKEHYHPEYYPEAPKVQVTCTGVRDFFRTANKTYDVPWDVGYQIYGGWLSRHLNAVLSQRKPDDKPLRLKGSDLLIGFYDWLEGHDFKAKSPGGCIVVFAEKEKKEKKNQVANQESRVSDALENHKVVRQKQSKDHDIDYRNDESEKSKVEQGDLFSQATSAPTKEAVFTQKKESNCITNNLTENKIIRLAVSYKQDIRLGKSDEFIKKLIMLLDELENDQEYEDNEMQRHTKNNT